MGHLHERVLELALLGNERLEYLYVNVALAPQLLELAAYGREAVGRDKGVNSL